MTISEFGDILIIKLIDIKKWPDRHKLRWQLLQYRPEERCISHREMPEWEDHCEFVDNHPYAAWYVVTADRKPVGTIYITKPGSSSLAGNEIGLDLFPRFMDTDIICRVIDQLMSQHPHNRYLWNTAVMDEELQGIIEKLGFTKLQLTYERRSE